MGGFGRHSQTCIVYSVCVCVSVWVCVRFYFWLTFLCSKVDQIKVTRK